MATCSYLLSNHAHRQGIGWPCPCPSTSTSTSTSLSRITTISNPTFTEIFKATSRRQLKQGNLMPQCSLYLVQLRGPSPPHHLHLASVSNIAAGATAPDASHTVWNLMHKFVLADLDPATAKLAIGFLGPFFSLFSFLFIIRIVMSWYPKLPVGKFPYVVAYAPTEPILVATRKVIPPLGGVDVTPVVWFGLISFLNEILVGPQGLLVLLSQQVGK